MNNIFELFQEICQLKELTLSDFIEERLDWILKIYEESLNQNCDEIVRSDLIAVVKELSRNEKSQ